MRPSILAWRAEVRDASVRARRSSPVPLSVLPGSVVGGLLATLGRGDYFNFHVCAFW